MWPEPHLMLRLSKARQERLLRELHVSFLTRRARWDGASSRPGEGSRPSLLGTARRLLLKVGLHLLFRAGRRPLLLRLWARARALARRRGATAAPPT